MANVDVVGFGALNVDRLYLVDRIPAKDEEGFVIDVRIAPGGSAANTVAALSRLGVKTAFIGKVGSDSDGDFLLNDMEREGINTFGVLRGKGRTGCALVFVDKAGNRAILVDPGVNDDVSFEDIAKLKLRGKILHLTSFICRKGNSPFEAQKKATEFFEVVSLDPGNIYARRSDIWDLINKAEIFLPNRAEIEEITGLNYVEGAEKAMARGVKIVAVKLGERGCYVTDGKKDFHVPAFKTRVVDTTGAGDAFNAGFLYALLKGYDLDVCGMAGNFVAARCIERMGARDGLPIKKELEEFLSKL